MRTSLAIDGNNTPTRLGTWLQRKHQLARSDAARRLEAIADLYSTSCCTHRWLSAAECQWLAVEGVSQGGQLLSFQAVYSTGA